MNYQKLKGKIKEVYNTQEAFGVAMEMSKSAISGRINGLVEWKTPEVVKACEVLNIPLSEAHLYFFTPNIAKSRF